ncbi:hypothetical protein LGH70_16915 [Hymenobacter sp. BT635]|uniref:KAP NTPase domain-containing protein n=1 Tax=Hymenobacter nitidus TaxID=2880929 RepID=A0ABS8AHG0_9BACT|nr:P-loop NTPase fold protein [Hymenobacter nitidus]MCB2379281.1 hypothetical protein [Hymenobacter nitidus]
MKKPLPKKKNHSEGKKPDSKFKFNKLQSIGAPDAESDHNLNRVFIENGEVDVLRDVTDAKCIIIGRTGSGKSALIKRLEEVVPKITRIEPESMSLKFLSNSTILRYFRELDVNLSFFYKVLWKHVFIVEILKLYIAEDGKKKEQFFDGLIERITRFGRPNPSKRKAIEYLQNWSESFWLQAEHRVKELEEEVGRKFTAATGIKAGISSVDLKHEGNESVKTKSEIKTKAEQVISEIQATELVEIIGILKTDILNNQQRKYFIVIDDLDKEWVSAQIVYDIIAAMIEVIKEFQVFQGVKIIIALRDNLHQLVFSAQEHRGGQREKFASLYLNLEWDNRSLKELINQRLKLLSDNTVDVSAVFEKSHKGQKNGFDYVVERTFMRPRDVISFVNKIISKSNSRFFFESSIIKQAEPEYSLERLHAIEDEWTENYGDIRRLWSSFHGIYNGFKLSNFSDSKLTDIYCDLDIIKGFKGELYYIFLAWREDRIKYKDFLQSFFYILFRIGIVGIKKSGQEATVFFYSKDSFTIKADFTLESRIYIHKMFYSALKINTKALENDYYEQS